MRVNLELPAPPTPPPAASPGLRDTGITQASGRGPSVLPTFPAKSENKDPASAAQKGRDFSPNHPLPAFSPQPLPTPTLLPGSTPASQVSGTYSSVIQIVVPQLEGLISVPFPGDKPFVPPESTACLQSRGWGIQCSGEIHILCSLAKLFITLMSWALLIC